jgi:hypothetical protein
MERTSSDDTTVNVIKINKIVIQSSNASEYKLDKLYINVFDVTDDNNLVDDKANGFFSLVSNVGNTVNNAIINASTNEEQFNENNTGEVRNYTTLLYDHDENVTTKELNFNDMYFFLRGRQGIEFTAGLNVVLDDDLPSIPSLPTLKYNIYFNQFTVSNISSFIPV